MCFQWLIYQSALCNSEMIEAVCMATMDLLHVESLIHILRLMCTYFNNKILIK